MRLTKRSLVKFSTRSVEDVVAFLEAYKHMSIEKYFYGLFDGGAMEGKKENGEYEKRENHRTKRTC